MDGGEEDEGQPRPVIIVVATCDLCECAVMPRKQNSAGVKRCRVKNYRGRPHSPPAVQSTPLSSLAPSRPARSLQIQTQTRAPICVSRYVCGCVITRVGVCAFFHTTGGQADPALCPWSFSFNVSWGLLPVARADLPWVSFWTGRILSPTFK